MNILGNSNCILHIISNMLKMQNPKLVDHGSRVGYLVAKMLETNGSASSEIIEAYILGLLHDVGAFKTEEIVKLIQFETDKVENHSIYGYLILKLSEVIEGKEEVILHHHTPWEKLKLYGIENKQLANLLFLADRVEIYLRSKGEPISEDKLENTRWFSEENIQLFKRTEEKFNVQQRLLDGSFINDTEKYLYQAEFSEDELRKLIRMVAILIDFRSESTVTHTITMVSAAVALAKLMGLKQQQIDEIYTGAYIHDLGKVAIPLEILEKPGKLDYDEMEVMKTHVILTGNIIGGHVSDNVYKIAMRHHEKLDGMGYPYGIKEEVLSLPERIVVVADIFSALTGKRSYKDSMPKEQVVAIMQQMSERHQIAGEVVDVLLHNYEAVEQQVNLECSKILRKYEEMKEEFVKISKIYNH